MWVNSKQGEQMSPEMYKEMVQDFLTEKALQKEFSFFEKKWKEARKCDFCKDPCLTSHCVTREDR